MMGTPPVLLPVEIIMGMVSEPEKYGNESYNKGIRKEIAVALVEAVMDTSADLLKKREKIASDTFDDPAEQERVEMGFNSRIASTFNVPRTKEGFATLMNIAYLTEMGDIIARFKTMPNQVAAHLALAILIETSVPSRKIYKQEYIDKMEAGSEFVKKIIDERGGEKAIMSEPDETSNFVEKVNDGLAKALDNAGNGMTDSEEERVKRIIEEARKLSNSTEGDN